MTTIRVYLTEEGEHIAGSDKSREMGCITLHGVTARLPEEAERHVTRVTLLSELPIHPKRTRGMYIGEKSEEANEKARGELDVVSLGLSAPSYYRVELEGPSVESVVALYTAIASGRATCETSYEEPEGEVMEVSELKEKLLDHEMALNAMRSRAESAMDSLGASRWPWCRRSTARVELSDILATSRIILE